MLKLISSMWTMIATMVFGRPKTQYEILEEKVQSWMSSLYESIIRAEPAIVLIVMVAAMCVAAIIVVCFLVAGVSKKLDQLSQENKGFKAQLEATQNKLAKALEKGVGFERQARELEEKLEEQNRCNADLQHSLRQEIKALGVKVINCNDHMATQETAADKKIESDKIANATLQSQLETTTEGSDNMFAYDQNNENVHEVEPEHANEEELAGMAEAFLRNFLLHGVPLTPTSSVSSCTNSTSTTGSTSGSLSDESIFVHMYEARAARRAARRRAYC